MGLSFSRTTQRLCGAQPPSPRAMAEPAVDWASLPADVHLAVQRHLSLKERWVGWEARGRERRRHAPPTARPPRARRCRCLCVCRAWRAAGAGLPELWECVEAGYRSPSEWTKPLLRWLAAWCATQQRPLRRLELSLRHMVITPDEAPALVAVLRCSSTSLQCLGLAYSTSLWEQLVHGERAQESGFLGPSRRCSSSPA